MLGWGVYLEALSLMDGRMVEMRECADCYVGAGSLRAGFDGAWWDNGQLLMLLAAQCMAAGTLMVPAVTRYVDPVMATGWHMILGGMPLIALSLATEQPELSTNLSKITPSTSQCSGYLCYSSLEYIAQMHSRSRISSCPEASRLLELSSQD